MVNPDDRLGAVSDEPPDDECCEECLGEYGFHREHCSSYDPDEEELS